MILRPLEGVGELVTKIPFGRGIHSYVILRSWKWGSPAGCQPRCVRDAQHAQSFLDDWTALQSQEEFITLANELAGESVRLDVPGGYYLCWSSESGAELWFQVDEDNDLIGMNPDFSGETRVRAGFPARHRSSGSPLDGAFQGWADPQGDDPENGSYPLSSMRRTSSATAS